MDGSTLNNRFEIVRSIGHGGAAIVAWAVAHPLVAQRQLGHLLRRFALQRLRGEIAVQLGQ